MKNKISKFLALSVVAFLVLSVFVSWPVQTFQVDQAFAAISSVSGTVAHGNTITINGSGFGTKSTAAPVVWDDASGTNILSKWDGIDPSPSLSSTYQTNYRSPMRGVSPPHNRVGRYIAGGHGCANCGGVAFWKTRTLNGSGYSYISWYQRMDPNWVFSGCSGAGACDDNLKTSSWSTGNGVYGDPYWYMSYFGAFKSATGTGEWASDVPPGGQYNYGSSATNPFQNWVKVEIVAKWSTGSDGFYQLYDNGRLVYSITGPTDFGSGTQRSDAIGGYARQYGQPNNWRYYTDAYLDYSLAHVILGNASTYNASTVREVQIPQSWSDSSIQVRVNGGALSDGSTAYLYVMDSNGNVNQNGYAVTLGSGGGTPPPPPPQDTTPPTVSISSPANNATVSGSINVTANASDNVGVVGVQFRLDGSNLGSEDTGAPYSVSLDTTTISNASHTLTAIARDAAGNTTTSSTVTVNVSNAVSGWTFCANEGGVCSFSGTKQVRYGLSGTYVTTTATGSINCTNTAFGSDPLPGADKICEYQNSATPIVGDINLDHIVNSIDYSILNAHWFTNDSTSDLNHDGLVNAIDYSLLNANWFRTW